MIKEIIERQNAAEEELSKETLKRMTYLMCTMMELKRLQWEIETNLTILRNQYNRNDFPKFLNSLSIFEEYVNSELLKNLRLITEKNLEGLSSGFFNIDQKKK